MPTLILPPRYTVDTNLVRKAAIKAGWDVERLQSWRVPETLCDGDPVLYGEPLFALVVAGSLNLSLIEPSFNWLSLLPKKWVQRTIRFMTLKDARNEGRAFIKPADDKCFIARVYDSGAELPEKEILPDAIPVLVSDTVNWLIEFRCFILEKQLVTLSPYLRNGEPSQSSEGYWHAAEDEFNQATDFINRFLADENVMLPPAVVVDVGIIEGSGWAVIEANAAWGSGIYGCDPTKVLDVLERASLKTDKATEKDSVWIPLRTV
jgi:ATP-grasp domain, R2K clade family 2